MNEDKLSRFGVSIPSKLLKKFDSLIKGRGYSNRSEAIRDLIRDYLVRDEWKSDGNVVGSLTIVYNHNVRGVSDRLIETQHHFHGNVISSIHVHLDEHNCVEVLVLEGKASEIRKIADHIIASRGVKHGDLVLTTKGKELE